MRYKSTKTQPLFLLSKIKIMKKLACLLLILFSISSCSTDTSDSENKAIIGKWNWVESSGGIAGITTTPQSTGKSIQLDISNTTVKRYMDGVLVYESSYSIQTGNSIFGGEKKLIIYENDSKQSFVRTDSQLILNDECYDCYLNKYIKE